MTQQHPAQPVNLAQKASLISEQWSPRVVAEMNDYQFKVVRIEGEFIWHSHPEPTKRFSCLKGHCASTFRTVPCMWHRVSCMSFLAE